VAGTRPATGSSPVTGTDPAAGQRPAAGAGPASGAAAAFGMTPKPAGEAKPAGPGRDVDLDRTVSLGRPADVNRPGDADRTANLGQAANRTAEGGAGKPVSPGPAAKASAAVPTAPGPAWGGPSSGTANAGSANAGSANAGTTSSGSANVGAPNAGSATAGPAGVGSAKVGSAGAGPAGVGSMKAGTAGPGPAGAGSATAGTAGAGPSNAGAAGVGTAKVGTGAAEKGGSAAAGLYGRAAAASGAARASVPTTIPGGASGVGSGEESAESGRRRGPRTKLLVSLAILIVVAMVGAVGIVVRPGPVDGWLDALSGKPASTPTPMATTPEPSPTPVLVAAESNGSEPDPATVKAELDPLVNAAELGPTVHIQVLDVASDTILYERNPAKQTTPASTTKVLTAATVLAARGPAYRLETRVVAGAKPGEVVIVGGGDATLAVRQDDKDLFPGAARLDDLAAQVKKALGGTKPTRVLVDTSLFEGPETATGWDAGDIPGGQVARIQSLMTNAGRVVPVHNEFGGDPRFSDPALAAGKLFAKMIGVSQSNVKRGAAEQASPVSASAGPAWTPGAELGKVASPPLVQIVDWMLQQSDNVLAEVLGRQVALAAGKEASFTGAAEAMGDKLTELGLPAEQAKLYDASGLSTRNGITPTLLVETLALAAGGSQPALGNMFNGLPVAGWSGTLETRFATPSGNATAQGVVRAKTGSLSGVNTLAGVLITREQRVLAFAIMAKGGADATTARAALDEVVARLVACGC
jgi:D-alanyl-D-alanine carboxypeptidase/D-alanyl-D-alanine-endopeptidase (penicillin-binding protein 4)